MSEPLPTTWAVTKIGELTVETEQRIPAPAEAFSYIDIASIDRGSKRILNPQHLTGKNAPSRARKVVRTGDVLVSMTRPNLNAVAHVSSAFEGQIASTGFDVLRAPEIDSRWLFYIVRTEEFVQRMSDLVQGALYPAVRSKDVRGFEVPLAPLGEQKRIADKLDHLLARADSCRERLDRVPLILRRFRQSVLAAATSGGLTTVWREEQGESTPAGELFSRIQEERSHRFAMEVAAAKADKRRPGWGQPELLPDPSEEEMEALPRIPDGWLYCKLGNLSEIVRGASPRPAGDPRYFGGNISWITVAELTKDEAVYLDVVEQCVTEEGRARSRYINVGTLLLTNSGATLGVPKITRIGGCINDGSVALVDIPLTSQLYLYYFLRGQTQHLRAINQGAAQPNLNTEIVKHIVTPLPPLAEQHEIVRRVETLFAFADRLEARLSAARSRTDRLTPSLLAKAFRGELVSQDPNDEPASVLLNRIRAERNEYARQPKAQKAKARKEISAVMKKLVEVLAEAGDWVDAQDAFRRCGVADGATTEQIEVLYAELRELVKSNRVSVEPVTNAQGLKQYDRLKLIGRG